MFLCVCRCMCSCVWHELMHNALNFLIAAWSNSHPFSDCLSSNSYLRIKGFLIIHNSILWSLLSIGALMRRVFVLRTISMVFQSSLLTLLESSTLMKGESLFRQTFSRWSFFSHHIELMVCTFTPYVFLLFLCIYMVSYASVQLQELLCVNILERSQMYTVSLCEGTLSHWKNDISRIKRTLFSIQSN